MMLALRLFSVAVALAWLPQFGLAQLCEVSPSFYMTVVSSPDVCADRSGDPTATALFATFYYEYKSVGGNPVFTSQLDADFPCVNDYVNRTIEDHSITGQVVVECRLNRDSRLQIGAHAISLKAEYEGVFPCAGDIATATATVMVEAPRAIAVTAAPPQTDVCAGSKTFSVIFSGAANPNSFIGALAHSAVLDGSTQCTTRADNGAVGVATSITVNCVTADPIGFSAGDHFLMLQASAADENLTMCAAPEAITLIARVVVLNPPTINLWPAQLQDATCYNSKSLNIRFNYEITDGGSSPAITGVAATPQLLGSKVRPGAATEIKCKTSLQASTSTKGQIAVTCSGNFAAASAASLSVQATLAATCSSGRIRSSSSTGLARRMLALPLAQAETVSSTAEDMSDTEASSDSSMRVSPTLDNSTASTVAAAAEDAPPVGPGTTRRSATSRHQLSCCLPDAMAYAFVGEGPRRSKCFKHTRPGHGRCTQVEGYYNQGPTENAIMRMIPQTPNLQRPTTPADCTGGIDVGTATATCLESKVIEITVQVRRVDNISRQLFYIDCVPPRAGQCPNDQWISPGPLTGSDSEYRYTTLVVEVPGSCTCNNAYWAVYEFGSFRGLPRANCNGV